MRTALVVDDTKNIRLLLSKCLENENFIVHSATNASDALDLVSKHAFDVAFIDIKMPNMSGTTLLEVLRSNRHAFPVIIMTAFATIKNAVTTTQMGAKAYLQKPFTSATIRKTLLEVFPTDESKLIPNSEPSLTSNVITNTKVTTEKNLSFHSLNLSLSSDPSNPIIYKELGDLLINLGEIEKGELFKDFSNKLTML